NSQRREPHCNDGRTQARSVSEGWSNHASAGTKPGPGAPQYRPDRGEYPLMSQSFATAIPAPQASSTLAGKAVALVGVLVSCAYLANLGAGVFLEIPDIL